MADSFSLAFYLLLVLSNNSEYFPDTYHDDKEYKNA